MAPRDLRSPGEVLSDPHGARSEQEYMESEKVMKTALTKSWRKVMASSSRLPVRRERKRLVDVVALGGRSKMLRHRRWKIY